MSRTKEDWENARQHALKIREKVYELYELLEDWPIHMNEGQDFVIKIEEKLEEDSLMTLVNALIGRNTINWSE